MGGEREAWLGQGTALSHHTEELGVQSGELGWLVISEAVHGSHLDLTQPGPAGPSREWRSRQSLRDPSQQSCQAWAVRAAAGRCSRRLSLQFSHQLRIYTQRDLGINFPLHLI